MKHVHHSRLTDLIEQKIAALAGNARMDTIHGGARSLREAKEADANKEDFGDYSAEEIVGDVYSASTGKPSPKYEAWECPNCGNACLGQEAANKCCLENDEADVYAEDLPEDGWRGMTDCRYE